MNSLIFSKLKEMKVFILYNLNMPRKITFITIYNQVFLYKQCKDNPNKNDKPEYTVCTVLQVSPTI